MSQSNLGIGDEYLSREEKLKIDKLLEKKLKLKPTKEHLMFGIVPDWE